MRVRVPFHRPAGLALALTALCSGALGMAAAAQISPGSTPPPSAGTCSLGVVCQVLPSATPAPTAAPTSAPPPPAPAPVGNVSVPAPVRSATVAAPRSYVSTGTSSAVSATFRNSPFVEPLLGILRNPISNQRPDLRHFRVATASLPLTSSAPERSLGALLDNVEHGPAGHSPLFAATVVALLVIVIVQTGPGRRFVIGAGARLMRIRHPALLDHRVRPQSWIRLGMIVVSAGVPGGAVVLSTGAAGITPMLAQAQTAQAAAPGATLARRTAGSAISTLTEASPPAATSSPTLTPAPPPAGAPDWSRLVVIERNLTLEQDELGQQEATMKRLADDVAQHPAPEIDDQSPGDIHNSALAGIREQLAQLVAEHTATQTAYQANLVAEYDLFRAASQDGTRKQQLLDAASHAGDATAKDAVSYDLSLLQTQIAQEQQIKAAETRLRTMGVLSGAQIAAIRQHLPFIAPLVAPMTQGFGGTGFWMEPPLTYNGIFYQHFHTGIDLSAPYGTPVHASADGIVILTSASRDASGRYAGYGNYVVIEHPDGFETLYGHLASVNVSAGQVVKQGQIVGLEGSTGWSTGPHVHFEIRHDGVFVDPLPFLGGQVQP